MTIFLIKKSLFYTSLMGAVILFSFVLFHIIPQDPARLILGPNATEGQISSFNKELGLDRPIVPQFLGYLKKLSNLDLGRSYIDKRSVLSEVYTYFKISLLLIFTSMMMIFLYSLLTVHLSYKGISLNKVNFVFTSTPSFFSGLLVAFISIKFFPFTLFSGQLNTINDFLFFLPPALALSVYPMGILSKIILKELTRISTSSYFLASRAMGVSGKIILYKYALRDAAIPFLAVVSNQLPALFTGAFIIEIIFSIPGVGTLLVKSIFAKDFPMIEGIIIFNGMIFFITNLIFEMTYPFIDPRIKE